MITIELINKADKIIKGKIDHEKMENSFMAFGEELCSLGIKNYSYAEGDYVRVRVDKQGSYYMVQLDETLAPSLLFFSKNEWIFPIPWKVHDKKSSVDTSYSSKRHSIMVRKAYEFETTNYQNLAINTHDQKEDSGVYPHAYANVETRNESIFFAKNAIDGKVTNLSHGSYPFASWGINKQEDASLTIDFGRIVEVDKIGLLFRFDHPHDSYWEQVRVTFSNDEYITLNTKKTCEFQFFSLSKQKTTLVTFERLKKAQDMSPFPALTQVEIFGKNTFAQII